MGSGGQAFGRNIVIKEDCWIGSLAGVRVGKSSTVGAGSLLHQVSFPTEYLEQEKRQLTQCAGCPSVHCRDRKSGEDEPWDL